MPQVLVAASVGITNETWMRRCLEASLGSASAHLLQFGSNAALTGLLTDMGHEVDVTGDTRKEHRSDIRKALAKSDHLLLLWDGRSLSQLLFEARLKGTPTKLHTIEVTQVVNKDRGDDFDIYIGRGTPWGNPFPVGKLEGQHERDESIELFKAHFEKSILSDPSMRKGLLSLKGLRLACHCKPLACHGDVIAGYLNSIDPVELEHAADSESSEPKQRRAA